MINWLWRWRAWVMTVSVTVLGGLLRLVNLGHPHALVFDEFYYPRGAYSLLTLGYEGDWGADTGFVDGDYSALSTDGDYVVHPMVGKLLIALGMKVAGYGPFGYRIAGAVLGTLTITIVAMLARRILKSTLWGGVAGLLLAVDGEAIVLSRTALLDVFLGFFAVLGFAFLWLDRWRAQRIYAAAEPGRTPRVGIRWWRIAAIITFGLACGVKWSGAYFAAGFLVLFVVLDAWDRREAGQRAWLPATIFRNALPGALAAIILIPLVYVAQWANWFLTDGSYGRQWAQNHPGEGVTWLPESLRSLLHYHQAMLDFHTGLTSPHPWEAHPAGWLIQFRPTLFYFERVDATECFDNQCVQSITSVGNPLIWWGAFAALCYAIWRFIVRKEALGMLMAFGTLAGWVPWAQYSDRTVFTFYTVAIAPFVVMTLAWALMRIARPTNLGGRYAPVRSFTVGWFLVAVLLVSAFFYPVWTGESIPSWYRELHNWLPTW